MLVLRRSSEITTLSGRWDGSMVNFRFVAQTGH